MTTDYTEIGNVLARLTNHLEVDRRFWRFHAEVDGTSLAVDLLDAVFDLESIAAQAMNAALRATIRGASADLPGGQAGTIQGMRDAIFASVDDGYAQLLKEEIAVTDDDIAAGPVVYDYINTNGAITLEKRSGIGKRCVYRISGRAWQTF